MLWWYINTISGTTKSYLPSILNKVSLTTLWWHPSLDLVLGRAPIACEHSMGCSKEKAAENELFYKYILPAKCLVIGTRYLGKGARACVCVWERKRVRLRQWLICHCEKLPLPPRGILCQLDVNVNWYYGGQGFKWKSITDKAFWNS